MTNEIDLTKTLVALASVGVSRYVHHQDPISEVEIVLRDFATRNIFPDGDIDVRSFLAQIHEIWNRNDRKRTIRYMGTRGVPFGIQNAYHRITGRLRIKKTDCLGLLTIFLSEWDRDGNPHPLYDEEKIRNLTNILFLRKDLEEITEARIEQSGLTEDDLWYLLQIRELLGRPIGISEIIPILKVRHKAE